MDPVALSVEPRQLARPFRVSHTTVAELEIVALRLRLGTASGSGEVTVGPWSTDRAVDVADAARRIVAQVPAERLGLDRVRRALRDARQAPPAARLLAEMALLALLATAERAPLWRLLDLPEPPARLPLWETVPLGELPSPGQGQGRRLKIKLGGPRDTEVLAALGDGRGGGTVLVDVNRGWSASVCERMIPSLAVLPLVALEDPVADRSDLPRVKALLPEVPLILDEGVCTAEDASMALRVADGVNVKLLKAGGLLEAREALERIAAAGKLAMLGCYIETPLAIAYAAQLAGLTTQWDLDGHTWLVDASPSELRLDAQVDGAAQLLDTRPARPSPADRG